MHNLTVNPRHSLYQVAAETTFYHCVDGNTKLRKDMGDSIHGWIWEKVQSDWDIDPPVSNSLTHIPQWKVSRSICLCTWNGVLIVIFLCNVFWVVGDSLSQSIIIAFWQTLLFLHSVNSFFFSAYTEITKAVLLAGLFCMSFPCAPPNLYY